LGENTIVNRCENGRLGARLQTDVANKSELHQETVVNNLRPQLLIRL
jgi:hypothetical protein